MNTDNYSILIKFVGEKCSNCIVGKRDLDIDYIETEEFIEETFFIVRKSKSYDWGVDIKGLMELGFVPSHIQSFNRKDELCVKIKTKK